MAKNKQPKTNVKMIKDLAKEMEYDAMLQLVVMHALTNYSETVASMDKQPDDWPQLISWDAWKRAGIKLAKHMNTR